MILWRAGLRIQEAAELSGVADGARARGDLDLGDESIVRLALLTDELVGWLACHPGTDICDLRSWLAGLLARHDLGEVDPEHVFAAVRSAGDWDRYVAILEDRLLVALIEASARALQDGTRTVPALLADALEVAVARLRVAQLVAQTASGRLELTRESLEQLLTCPVVLPGPPFPLVAAPRTAGPPVIADLYVVRDEWSRYVAGELAFIENVMPGEERARSTRTTNRSETVLESETLDVSRSRHETYESERTTEANESSRQTTLEIGLQFDNELNVKYGPIENTTKVGASLAFSRTEAQRRATEIARESGRRAVEETEKVVRQLKRQTRETTVRELDAHNLSNPNGSAVRGVYRWVERVQRYQLVRFPHRLQLEFYLPEPGKFLRALLEVRRSSSDEIPVPPALYLTEDGTEGAAALSPDSITAENYLEHGARLESPDLPPPPAEALVVTESLAVSGGTREKEIGVYDYLPFPPVASGTKEIELPDGYQADAWGASAAAAPELAKWGDHTDAQHGGSDDGVDEQVGYHSVVAAVTVGSTNVLIRNRVMVNESPPSAPPKLIQSLNTVHVGPTDYRDRWLAENASWRNDASQSVTTASFAVPLVGKLSFGATLGGAYSGTVSITLHCTPTSEAMSRWRAGVFSVLSTVVSTRRREIANATAANQTASADTLRRAISPSIRAAIVRDEFKRQILECLLGERFSGFDDAPTLPDGNGVERPDLRFDQALLHAGFVRFFEQSFEWENMMHVLYPPYWSSSRNWDRRVAFEDSDPMLTAFLDAGASRVLVPARPGFERGVFTFLELGLVLGDGNALGRAAQPSLSVADEIMSLTRPPKDGEPGESWEANVPTALLWLDTELELPLDNTASVLDQPPGVG